MFPSRGAALRKFLTCLLILPQLVYNPPLA
jgi:hypothetical protein